MRRILLQALVLLAMVAAADARASEVRGLAMDQADCGWCDPINCTGVPCDDCERWKNQQCPPPPSCGQFDFVQCMEGCLTECPEIQGTDCESWEPVCGEACDLDPWETGVDVVCSYYNPW
jgi:hypothetical protein